MASNWLFWAALSALFAAATAVLAKAGLAGVDPDLATLLRTLVIVAVLAPFVALAGKWVDPLQLPARPLVFVLLSGLATGASWLCYFRALQLGTVAQVAPVDKFSLVLAALLAFAFLGERPTAREWVGIVLVAGGMLVIASRR